MVKKINGDSFDKEVIDYKGVVLVDFYADWCGPCKLMSPIIDELSNELKQAKFVKVNIDENSQFASKYSVFSIPTFIVFKDGNVKNQLVGALDKEKLLSEIKNALK